VHLVDDVDLEAALCRLIADIFNDLAHLVDAAVGCAVDFQHIDGTTGGDFTALIALIAWRWRGALRAVERFGEDTGGSGLTDATYTGKKVSVGDPISADGVLQRARYVRLSRNIFKILRAPFARYYEVRHRRMANLKF